MVAKRANPHLDPHRFGDTVGGQRWAVENMQTKNTRKMSRTRDPGRNHVRTGVRTQVRAGLLLAAAGVLCASVEKPAFALQGGEDPATLPVLVDKRFGLGGRHQASLMFSTSVATKFVEHLGVYAGYTYSFTDMLGAEVSGGFFFSNEATIADRVRQGFPEQTGRGEQPPITDFHQLEWMAMGTFVFTPIYGKMSFLSELDPSFDLFLLAGVGAAGTRVKQGDITSGSFGRSVGVVFSLGGGMRFYINRLLAIRLELRDFFFPEGASGIQNMQGDNLGGLTWQLSFQVGVQFTFGGE